MHFRVEADPEEFRDKSPDLIRALIKAIAPHDPAFAESLEKALPAKESPLRLPVLKGLHERTAAAYEKQMALMLRDIGRVLNRSLQKGEFYDYTKAIADKSSVAYARVKEVLKRQGLYFDGDLAIR